MPPGRKQLPHNTPCWLEDPSTEIYFLTICAEKRGDSLMRNDSPGRLLESIRFYNGAKKWRVNLAVVMPDHVHMLASFDDKLLPAVRAWKHWTGRHLGVEWQRDFFEHRLRREESLTQKVSYILDNPVRAGWWSIGISGRIFGLRNVLCKIGDAKGLASLPLPFFLRALPV